MGKLPPQACNPPHTTSHARVLGLSITSGPIPASSHEATPPCRGEGLWVSGKLLACKMTRRFLGRKWTPSQRGEAFPSWPLSEDAVWAAPCREAEALACEQRPPNRVSLYLLSPADPRLASAVEARLRSSAGDSSRPGGPRWPGLSDSRSTYLPAVLLAALAPAGVPSPCSIGGGPSQAGPGLPGSFVSQSLEL